MYGVWDLNSAAQVSIFLNTGNTPNLSLSFLTCLTLTLVNSAILSSEKPIDFIWENSLDVFGKPFFSNFFSSLTNSDICSRNQGSILVSL